MGFLEVCFSEAHDVDSLQYIKFIDQIFLFLQKVMNI